MKKLPASFELPLFALLLSGLMPAIVSGIALKEAIREKVALLPGIRFHTRFSA